MVSVILRFLLAALAITGVVVFIVQLDSDRNDAIYIGQSSFLIFPVMAALNFRDRNGKAASGD